MLPLELQSPTQIAQDVAARARALRLQRAWTQSELAERSGMSLSSLRRFERTGQIAFLSLVRLAIALDATQGLSGLFPHEPASLEEVLQGSTRQRGRRR